MNANTEKDQATIEKARTLNNVPWCEQYERMISGMLYDPFGPELSQARFEARRLTTKYNQHYPDDATIKSLTADRAGMMRKLLGSVGQNAYIEPPFYVDYGCNIIVGDDFYCNFNTTILDCGLVTIGDRVLFGPNCSIYAATHETSVESRRQGVEYAREVVIGNDCWIGGGVGIVAGVKIGDGCTIGAGSMVTKDIPAWSVAVGCPARVIKKVDPAKPLESLAAADGQ